MSSLFLWETGPARVYIIWIVVLLAQIAIAEINRRWNWTIFVLWTGVGIAMIPYAAIHGTPILGWFPFGKYLLMVATATMTGALLVIGKRKPESAHRYAIWMGVALWIGLVANIMEANIRDLTIFFHAQEYLECAANWQCLQQINATHAADMIAGLPEARNITAPLHSPEWYQSVAQNFANSHVGIDPETGFRTIGGYWNLLSATAGLLNCITVTGIGKIFVSSPNTAKVRGLIWIDQLWPWVIAYDLWNHAFLYNALADYTWYCSFALLLACTIPAFTWAKGQWIWFRCFTLVFWISFYNWLPELSGPPGIMNNFATMNPNANIACSALALIWNIGLFIYWLMLIARTRRNPLTNVMFTSLTEFRTVVREHCDDRDKYWLADCIKENPSELGWEPMSNTPPTDGYIGWMPWWKRDKRYPKARTPLRVDKILVKKGIKTDPNWDVTDES